MDIKNTTMVQVKNLNKSYGEVMPVDRISFEIHASEIFGLLGPNGAGKTSTLECLEGLRRADSGILRVAGIDPWREPRRLNQVIGVQLQTSSLPESITPLEAMQIFCAYHKVETRYDLLERLGLNAKRDAQYYELSSGQQRRLALALAVAHRPQVLFLDEPTAGLDVATRVQLHDLMRELRESGATIILATHDMAEAEAMSDRVAILLNGEIVSVGAPMEITATGSDWTKISVRTLDGCFSNPTLTFPAVEQRLDKDGYAVFFSVDIGATVSALIAHIEAQTDTLIDLRVERPSLEECFLDITQPDSRSPEGAHERVYPPLYV